MSILCLRTNVHPWRARTLTHLDSVLVASGARLLDFCWTGYEYISDGLHFTSDAQHDFSHDMAACLAAHFPRGATSLYVVTDSTVDHAPRGHVMLESALRRLLPRSVAVGVDAVCGSGFVRMADVGLDFGSRIRQAIRRGVICADTVVVIIGGWNDVEEDQDRLYGTVSRLLRHVRRHFEVGERHSKLE